MKKEMGEIGGKVVDAADNLYTPFLRSASSASPRDMSSGVNDFAKSEEQSGAE